MKTLKNLSLTAVAAFALFAAITFVFGGGLFAPSAHAGGTRPVVVAPPNPVTVQMQQALTKEFTDFLLCTKNLNRTDSAKLEEANKDAGWAAAYADLARFNRDADIIHAEIARLKPIYCT